MLSKVSQKSKCMREEMIKDLNTSKDSKRKPNHKAIKN